MIRHIASVHEGKKTFKCEFCDFSSFQKGNVNQHVAVVHEKKKPFPNGPVINQQGRKSYVFYQKNL